MRLMIRVSAFLLLVVGIFPLAYVNAAQQEGPAESLSALAPATQQEWISAIGSDRIDQLVRLSDKHSLSVLLNITASNGKSALMVAAKRGDLALAKRLVSHGADVHDITITNGTAFMFAILGNQRDMVEWLHAEGADINIVGSNGWTALTIAAAKGNADLLQWLLDRGAAGQIRDVYRYTPLLRAVENGYIETASILLTLPDTDINAQDEYDNTALHHAVSSINIPMVKLLLTHGADSDIKNRQGLSPRDLASGVSGLESVL